MTSDQRLFAVRWLYDDERAAAEGLGLGCTMGLDCDGTLLYRAMYVYGPKHNATLRVMDTCQRHGEQFAKRLNLVIEP